VNYDTILEHMKNNRKEIGSRASPCVRIRLRTGERFTLARILEANDNHFITLAFLDEETLDETPRFRFLAVDPKEICLIEAFEPAPRAPEATKRFGFPVSKVKEGGSGAQPKATSSFGAPPVTT
jgi:hypothetical protein